MSAHRARIEGSSPSHPTRASPWRPAWVLACLSLACAACGAFSRSPSTGAPGSAVGFSRAPVIDGSRRACLLPPYTPGNVPTLADGTVVTREADGARWVFTLQGERDVPGEVVAAALDRLRAAPGLRALSYGVYCGDGSRTCLIFEGNVCEVRVEDALGTVRAALARDPEIAGARLEIAVQLAGRLGPRCDERDSSCLPVAYEDGDRYDRSGPRIGGAFASHSAGACAHDGECVVMGCGNHCLLWEYGGANEGATCEGYTFAQPIYCGCVERQCQWFRQQ